METAVQHTTVTHQGTPQEITGDLAMVRAGIANVFFYGPQGAGDRGWVLIDTGIPGLAGKIKASAKVRFGNGARPSAIILTHGHFDHVGAVQQLSREWDVPVYAHKMELPYLTGRSSYPPPDPTVGGGAMTLLSPLYPRGPIDLGDRVHALPGDSTVPGMPGWRCIYTPGHSPGHVALFRDADRTLLAGDALVTVRQESALAVMAQRPEIHRPPAYFTPDWALARLSFRTLVNLEPEIVATGHGVPLRGSAMRAEMHRLAHSFEQEAIPGHGRYTDEPAITDESGVRSVPPTAIRPGQKAMLAFGGALAVGLMVGTRRR